MLLISGIKCFHNQYFIKGLLYRIKLSKQIFVLDLEQGREANIPQDLG